MLKNAGYKTYASLGKAKIASLKKIVSKAGRLPYKVDPSTWSKQAVMANKGEWSKLVKWQKSRKLVLA